MENLFVATEKKFAMDKFVSQVNVVPEVEVKKILKTNAKVCVTNFELQSGILDVSGRVSVEVVYLGVDNLIYKAENQAEFFEKQKLPFELSDIFVDDQISLQSVNVYSGEIVCVAIHDVKLVGVYKYELPTIEDKSEMVLDKEEFDAFKLVCVCDDNFVVAEEIEKNFVDASVLTSSANVILTNFAIEEAKVVLEGKILADVTCLQNGSVASFAEEFSFRQEVSAENATKDMVLNPSVVLKNMMVTSQAKDDKTVFVFAIDMYCKNYVYEKVTYEVASDIFSLKNELDVAYDYIESKNYNSSKQGTDSVLSQTDVSFIEDFDDILTVSNAKLKIVDIVNEDDKAVVSVEIFADAYYKTLTSVEAIDVYKPYTFEILKDCGLNVSSIDFICEISSFKVKAGKDLEVMFKLEYLAKYETQTSERFVKSFELKQEKSVNDFGIKVYITKQNQSIFDIAKILNVTPEIIEKQNQIDDGFEAGQKIYVYSPVNLI